MRVSLNWLKEYVDLPTADPVELARAFDMLGHAVEEVEFFDAEWTDVVIGRVLRIEAHPDADNVRVTHVDIGDGAEHQIICGAWNFDEGAVVPVSVPGAVLPGGFQRAAVLEKKPGKIQSGGIRSQLPLPADRPLAAGIDHLPGLC